jgi:glycosyltransferase involved in cell wall biosynthesis
VRILHIDTGPVMRGGQYQVLLLLSGLREAGHDSVLLAREGGALAAAAAAQGFSVYPAGLRELWRRSKQSALVHAHDARGHTLAAIASRRKFVVSRRVAFPVRRSFLSSWKYRRAVRFLAVSQFVAAELLSAGIRNENIDIVYDGVETIEANNDWNPGAPIVALASHDPQKGRDLVEKAAQLSGTPILYSDNLKEDLRRASMFVYITRSEGLGSAALLAMSMGVPVIASRVGGLTEVFIDGTSGLFVENSAENIARAMQKLLSDPDLAGAIRRQALQRIAQEFTCGHLVRRTVACYQRALAS